MRKHWLHEIKLIPDCPASVPLPEYLNVPHMFLRIYLFLLYHSSCFCRLENSEPYGFILLLSKVLDWSFVRNI